MRPLSNFAARDVEALLVKSALLNGVVDSVGVDQPDLEPLIRGQIVLARCPLEARE